MTTKIGSLAFCGFASVLLAGSVASASLLSATNAIESGSQNTTNGTLDVTVEYAVQTAADFLADNAGLGYTPTPGELVYSYQVHNNSTSATEVTQQIIMSIPAVAAANNIGTFSIGDVDATFETLAGGTQATWFFSTPQVPVGQTSFGLAFSSPNAPVLDLFSSTTVGLAGGSVTLAVHRPGTELFVIPEPSSMLLVGLATLSLLRRQR